MKPLKDTFRDFTKSLLVYLDAPSMDYEGVEIGDAVKAKENEGDTLLKGEHFQSKRKKVESIIKTINLDANTEVRTQAEKNLEESLMDHNTTQFDLLEHNYETALNKLGEGGEEIKKVEQMLRGKVDEFIQKMDAHVLKENVEKGNDDAKGEIVDRYIASKGIAFQGLKGLGKYIVKGNETLLGDIQGESQEEIFQALDKVLNNEQVLENAIKEMKKDLPNFEATSDEKDYFKDQFTKDKDKKREDRLNRFFGENNEEKATETLAKRFHIEFKKGPKKEPEYVVDLTTNKVYQAGTEWDKKLLEVCQSIKNKEEITRHDQGIDNLAIEQKAKADELENGVWYRADDEVRGISDLADNSVLISMLRTTNGYIEKANQELTPTLQDIQKLANPITRPEVGTQLDTIVSTLNPEYVRQNGLIGQLKELLEMIRVAVTGSDTETLTRINNDLKEKRNPVESKKRREFYTAKLEKADLATLIKLGSNPDKKTFEKLLAKGEEAPDLTETSEKTYLKRAIEQRLNGQFEVKDAKITTVNSVTFIKFSKGEHEYTIAKINNGFQLSKSKKSEVEQETINFKGKEANLTALADHVTGRTEKRLAKEQAAEKIKEELRGKVKDELMKLAKKTTYGKGNRGISPLGELINQLKEDETLPPQGGIY